LHEGDYVEAIVEDNAERSPLALRPLVKAVSAETGLVFLNEVLSQERHLLTSSTSVFLEAAAVAFGKQPLEPSRVAAFDAIRAADQRILEFPSSSLREEGLALLPGGRPSSEVGPP
jgi:hypothetical protein